MVQPLVAGSHDRTGVRPRSRHLYGPMTRSGAPLAEVTVVEIGGRIARPLARDGPCGRFKDLA